jgi:hypothetical protein
MYDMVYGTIHTDSKNKKMAYGVMIIVLLNLLSLSKIIRKLFLHQNDCQRLSFKKIQSVDRITLSLSVNCGAKSRCLYSKALFGKFRQSAKIKNLRLANVDFKNPLA